MEYLHIDVFSAVTSCANRPSIPPQICTRKKKLARRAESRTPARRIEYLHTYKTLNLFSSNNPSRYNEAVGVYEYKHREWERLEVERKERLSVKCHQSRLDHLNLDSLAGLTKWGLGWVGLAAPLTIFSTTVTTLWLFF